MALNEVPTLIRWGVTPFLFVKLHVVPTAPRDLQLSLTQLDPPIVLVTWTPPLDIQGPLSGYKLTYGVVGDSYIEERRFDAEITRFTTGFLGLY